MKDFHCILYTYKINFTFFILLFLYLALGLQTAIDNMAGYEDEALQIQITVFEEHKLADESQMPMIPHQELFDKLRKKVNLKIY